MKPAKHPHIHGLPRKVSKNLKLFVQIGLIDLAIGDWQARGAAHGWTDHPIIMRTGMKNFLRALGRKKPIQIKQSLVEALDALAQEGERDLDGLAEEFIAQGVAQKQQAAENLNLWDKLSPREKEVVGLVCLGYMNKEIGQKLYISPRTVKTHVSNALRKFGVRRRGEIQMLLADWDFGDWER